MLDMSAHSEDPPISIYAVSYCLVDGELVAQPATIEVPIPQRTEDRTPAMSAY